MIVDQVQRTFADGRCEVSARLRPREGEGQRVWFSYSEEVAAPGEPDATPFLPSALNWCMRRREQLLIDGPVSPAVLGRLEKIMSVMVSLFPGEREPVRVEATAAAEPPRGADLNACFFSGGVDSWDTVLTLLEEHPNGVRPPTHLIFSPDFKPASFTEQQLEHKVAAAQASADALGLGFIALETNLKRTIKGPILVAAGLALGSTGILVPSGVMQAVLRPKMTHPTLDPHFSTEATKIVHFGSAGRMEKMARISRSQVALDRLDVCKDDHPAGELNCGYCERCLRTMIGLHVYGALARCHAFQRPLETGRLLTLERIGEPHSWLELLYALGDTELDRRLAAGIRLALMRDQATRMKDLVRGLDSDARAIPAYRRASRAVARSMKDWDSAERRVAELQHQLLIANADHR